MKTRIEKDSLGTRQVPAKALYGVETLRATENFPISGLRFQKELSWAFAVVKKSCAKANMATKRLDARRGRAIIRACDELIQGKHLDQFVTDVLQAGAGVSAHMNANEVIANRALEILKKRKGDYDALSSHDHVNMGQSTNDVVPTAIRLAVLKKMPEFLTASKKIEKAIAKKSKQFRRIVKSGRTHLQDAAPITLGQEFSGWMRQLEKSRNRLERVAKGLFELGIGGSAVGTGLNTTLAYRRKVIQNIRKETGLKVVSGKNLFELTQSDIDFAAVSSGLRNYALCLAQICSDLRLLSSGPHTGFAEIILPARQPGSSIMPGKVNPVMPEAASQVAYQVVGNDVTISLAASSGHFQLNVMRPVVAYNLLQSIHILTNTASLLTDFCITGIKANVKRCQEYAEKSYGIAAALNPYIGYSKAADCVKESMKTGKTLREVVLSKKWLTPKQLDKILSPKNLTQPKNK